MKRHLLIKRAYREAAAALTRSASAIDLGDDLNAIEEAQIREFIRVQIVDILTARGEPRPRPTTEDANG